MADPKKDLSEEERRELLEALRKIDPRELERMRGSLGETASMLEEMIHGFPAAQKFLRLRGAARVSELSPAQLQELEAFIAHEWFGKRPN